MGKGRKPCCDKAGVKKGPWSQAEDLKLISFIQNHGHSNWRALPKLAGLVRCGKSCRLRWVNYLRPDLKRGNFTRHEEEAIIKLHEVLGNKWSKIASYFPGRTDNEIKNVWNTHLKKRIKVPNEIKEDCSKQILQHQSSFSSSNNSLNLQTSDSNQPQLNKEVSNNHIVEQNACEESGTISNGGDLLDELIEIPFESNLELWDLLEGDSNLNDQHSDYYVQSNKPESPKLGQISKNDKKDYMECDGSWWWVMYLENELGLNQNEITPLQATSSSNDGLIFKE